jgi:hypothetical protein
VYRFHRGAKQYAGRRIDPVLIKNQTKRNPKDEFWYPISLKSHKLAIMIEYIIPKRINSIIKLAVPLTLITLQIVNRKAISPKDIERTSFLSVKYFCTEVLCVYEVT